MASSSFVNRVLAFFRSPQGRRLVDQGRRQLSQPGNRSKLQALLAKLRGRR
ncbi:hypothetical protein GCM10009557_88500 [Virgisporangium ochraceum]|jgi:hypothetical protein|uniref:Uncharacterized protein n=1 Tax=Virgisporangium ochraceum TaxID=65505 RepID=A0A8J3ZZJ8_9ACTN|nr:hypothetical protein [Virgisporangium ochraceum]GIJ72481.1 hypothetical protein Voc01_073980 [Virgisporangium ochraceum]